MEYFEGMEDIDHAEREIYDLGRRGQITQAEMATALDDLQKDFLIINTDKEG